MLSPQDDNEEFEFYLKFAKPLILNLPDTNDRIKAAAWIRKIKDTTTDTALRNDYLKLLLFVLQRRKLIGPFGSIPDETQPLEKFPEEINLQDVAKNFVEIDKKILKETLEKGGYGEWPPYTVACSSDLTEYAASQEIPNFGTQVYFAISTDPLQLWDHFENAMFPIGENVDISKPEWSIADTVSPNISCFVPPEQTDLSVSIRSPTVSPRPAAPVSPKSPIIATPSPFKSPTTDESPSPRQDISPRSPIQQSPEKDDYNVGTRIPPTWGSNLVNVKEASPIRDSPSPSPMKDLDIEVSEQDMLDFFNDDIDLDEYQYDEGAAYLQASHLFSSPERDDTLTSDLRTPSPVSRPAKKSPSPKKPALSPEQLYDAMEFVADQKDMADYYNDSLSPDSREIAQLEQEVFKDKSPVARPIAEQSEAAYVARMRDLEQQLLSPTQQVSTEVQHILEDINIPTTSMLEVVGNMMQETVMDTTGEGLGGTSFIAPEKKDFEWLGDTSQGPGLPENEEQNPELWESFGWWTDDPDEIFEYFPPSPKAQSSPERSLSMYERWADVPPTPPIFSKDPKIREGRGAERIYAIEEFGMESFEEPVWTSAEQYLKYKTQSSPFKDPRDEDRKTLDVSALPKSVVPRRFTDIQGTAEEQQFFSRESDLNFNDISFAAEDYQPMSKTEARMKALRYGPTQSDRPPDLSELTTDFAMDNVPQFMLDKLAKTPPSYEAVPEIELDISISKYIEDDLKIIHSKIPATTPQRSPSPRRPPPIATESPPISPEIEPGEVAMSPGLEMPKRHVMTPRPELNFDYELPSPIKLPKSVTPRYVPPNEEELLKRESERLKELAVLYEREFESPPRIPSPPPLPGVMDQPVPYSLPPAMTPYKMPPTNWAYQSPPVVQTSPVATTDFMHSTKIGQEMTMFFETPPREFESPISAVSPLMSTPPEGFGEEECSPTCPASPARQLASPEMDILDIDEMYPEDFEDVDEESVQVLRKQQELSPSPEKMAWKEGVEQYKKVPFRDKHFVIRPKPGRSYRVRRSMKPSLSTLREASPDKSPELAILSRKAWITYPDDPRRNRVTKADMNLAKMKRQAELELEQNVTEESALEITKSAELQARSAAQVGADISYLDDYERQIRMNLASSTPKRARKPVESSRYTGVDIVSPPLPEVSPEPMPTLMDEPLPEGLPRALLPPSGWTYKSPPCIQTRRPGKQRKTPEAVSPVGLPRGIGMLSDSPPTEMLSPSGAVSALMGSPPPGFMPCSPILSPGGRPIAPVIPEAEDIVDMAQYFSEDMDEIDSEQAMLYGSPPSPAADWDEKVRAHQPIGYRQKSYIVMPNAGRKWRVRPPKVPKLDTVEESSPEAAMPLSPGPCRPWRKTVAAHKKEPYIPTRYMIIPENARKPVIVRKAKKPGLATVEEKSPPADLREFYQDLEQAVDDASPESARMYLDKEIAELESQIFDESPVRKIPPRTVPELSPDYEYRMWREGIRLHEPVEYGTRRHVVHPMPSKSYRVTKSRKPGLPTVKQSPPITDPEAIRQYEREEKAEAYKNAMRVTKGWAAKKVADDISKIQAQSFASSTQFPTSYYPDETEEEKYIREREEANLQKRQKELREQLKGIYQSPPTPSDSPKTPPSILDVPLPEGLSPALVPPSNWSYKTPPKYKPRTTPMAVSPGAQIMPSTPMFYESPPEEFIEEPFIEDTLFSPPTSPSRYTEEQVCAPTCPSPVRSPVKTPLKSPGGSKIPDISGQDIFDIAEMYPTGYEDVEESPPRMYKSPPKPLSPSPEQKAWKKQVESYDKVPFVNKKFVIRPKLGRRSRVVGSKAPNLPSLQETSPKLSPVRPFPSPVKPAAQEDGYTSMQAELAKLQFTPPKSRPMQYTEEESYNRWKDWQLKQAIETGPSPPRELISPPKSPAHILDESITEDLAPSIMPPSGWTYKTPPHLKPKPKPVQISMQPYMDIPDVSDRIVSPKSLATESPPRTSPVRATSPGSPMTSPIRIPTTSPPRKSPCLGVSPCGRYTSPNIPFAEDRSGFAPIYPNDYDAIPGESELEYIESPEYVPDSPDSLEDYTEEEEEALIAEVFGRKSPKPVVQPVKRPLSPISPVTPEYQRKIFQQELSLHEPVQVKKKRFMVRPKTGKGYRVVGAKKPKLPMVEEGYIEMSPVSPLSPFTPFEFPKDGPLPTVTVPPENWQWKTPSPMKPVSRKPESPLNIYGTSRGLYTESPPLDAESPQRDWEAGVSLSPIQAAYPISKQYESSLQCASRCMDEIDMANMYAQDYDTITSELSPELMSLPSPPPAPPRPPTPAVFYPKPRQIRPQDPLNPSVLVAATPPSAHKRYEQYEPTFDALRFEQPQQSKKIRIQPPAYFETPIAPGTRPYRKRRIKVDTTARRRLNFDADEEDFEMEMAEQIQQAPDVLTESPPAAAYEQAEMSMLGDIDYEPPEFNMYTDEVPDYDVRPAFEGVPDLLQHDTSIMQQIERIPPEERDFKWMDCGTRCPWSS